VYLQDSHPRRARQPHPKDYASDSGMSESGTPAGPMPRSMTKRHEDMRGSTVLYTESRPSILSTERFAFTQHSGTARSPVSYRTVLRISNLPPG